VWFVAMILDAWETDGARAAADVAIMTWERSVRRRQEIAEDADRRVCREIADDFIIAVDWFTVTRDESRGIVQMLKRYPREPIDVALLPCALEQEAWVL
jgi:hypothetical protein